MAKSKKHGGARVGAGRKKNTPLQAAKRRAERQLENMADMGRGRSPVDVMLMAMHDEVEKQQALAVEDRRWREAVAIAAAVAPYVHPRLAAVAVEADVKVTTAQDILQDLDGQTRGLPGPPASSQTTH